MCEFRELYKKVFYFKSDFFRSRNAMNSQITPLNGKLNKHSELKKKSFYRFINTKKIIKIV